MRRERYSRGAAAATEAAGKPKAISLLHSGTTYEIYRMVPPRDTQDDHEGRSKLVPMSTTKPQILSSIVCTSIS
ncbi:hypothetical protein ANTPLA_LOCUS3637 [Anthophora plagiata]